ncbi:hypothetical protein [Zongyangia hominis]|uniref:Lipoprotein n=1 Tax=Zongyangia hominis TaxID=2763677 RepID=A0A926EA99_9FIRM|nr:hypothetical protein [Zongyangia hominis]MBC8570088.1 hypothetical protein [Zongyangia hominis]
MKRIACLLLSLLLMTSMLAGCGKSPAEGGGSRLSEEQVSEKLQTDFASTAKIKYKGIEAEAQVKKADGTCVLDFTAPENLNGMQFSLSGEKLGIGYKGFHVDLDPNSAVGGAAVKMLVKAIQTAAEKNGVDIAVEKDAVQITSTQQSFQFTMRLDAKSGNILNIQVPGEELDISFENFTFLQ